MSGSVVGSPFKTNLFPRFSLTPIYLCPQGFLKGRQTNLSGTSNPGYLDLNINQLNWLGCVCFSCGCYNGDKNTEVAAVYLNTLFKSFVKESAPLWKYKLAERKNIGLSLELEVISCRGGIGAGIIVKAIGAFEYNRYTRGFAHSSRHQTCGGYLISRSCYFN